MYPFYFFFSELSTEIMTYDNFSENLQFIKIYQSKRKNSILMVYIPT